MSKISSKRGSSGGMPIEIGSERYKRLMKKDRLQKVDHKDHKLERANRVMSIGTPKVGYPQRDSFETATAAPAGDWAAFLGQS